MKELFVGWTKVVMVELERKSYVIAFRCAGKEVSLRTML